MSRERYELVRAAELKVGDVIRAGADGYLDFTVHDYKLRPGDGEVTVYSKSDSGKIESDDFAEGEELFRRLPDTDEADVLRRALRSALNDLASMCDKGQVSVEQWESEAIDQARHELESEGSDDSS